MSGSTIGGVVGGAIGFYFGGPQGAQWGFMIGSAVGGYADPEKVKGPRLGDSKTQTSNEGVPRPLVYATACMAGNIIQCGPLIETKNSERTGKGGGPIQETYTYTRTVAIRICEAAPLDGAMKLRRAWMDDKLVYDATGTGVLDADSAKFRQVLTFYDGAEDQLPDASLEALPAAYGGGVGNVPSYRGTCYAVLANLDCTDRQGSVSQFRWEVSSSAVETHGEDCYPANWIVGGSRTPTQAALAISTDAVTFATTNESFSCYFPVWKGDDILMGTAASAVFSSNGGVSFSATSASGSGWGGSSTTGAAFAQGTWLVAKNDNKVFHSSNGTSFTGVSIVGTGGTYCDGGIATMGSRIMVAGNSSAYSDDGGVTWTASTGFVFEGGVHSCIDIASDGTTKFLVGANGNTNNHNIFKNTSGNTWTAVTSPFGSGTDVVAITYDVADHRWGAFSGRNFAYSTDGERWTLVPNALPSGASPADGSLAGYGGKWIVGVSTGISSAEIYSSLDGGLTWSQRTSGLDYAVAGAAHNGEPMQGIEFPDAHGFFVTTDGEITAACIPQSFSAGTLSLAAIVGDLCARAGVDSAHVSLAALASTTVRGYPIATQTSAAEAIRPLKEAFFFDLPEWGNSGDSGTKLRAVLRGGATAVTVADDDLLDTDDDATRPQQVEFPRKVTLAVSDPDSNYEPAPQPAERTTENVKAVGEVTISTPVIFNRTEAAVIVDKFLMVLWEEALGRVTIQVPEEFSRFTPGDIAMMDSKRWRIEQTTLMEGYSEWTMVRDRASAYSSSASGSSAQTPASPASSARGPTVFEVMNLPSLRSADNQAGVYLAAQGLLPGWVGADIYLSVDGGVSEQKVATIQNPATMGELAEACDADGADSTGLISVKVYWGGELDSITDDQMSARLNGFSLITDGVSEVGQFKTATEASTERLYDLTNVLRGQLGTEADSHAAGDRFVLLDGNVRFLPLDVALAGQALIFRAVSIGTAPAKNATTNFVFDPPIFIRDGGVVTP